MIQEMTKAEIEQSKTVFCEALRSVLPSLRRRGDSYIQDRVGKERLEDAALELKAFMEDGTAKPLSRHEEHALACRLMGCLATYVSNILQLDLSINTVTKNVTMLSASVNRAFPGYADSKLLCYIISPRQSQYA